MQGDGGMYIPTNILWGVAGFVLVAGIRIGFKALKDINHAHIKIRYLERVIKKLSGDKDQ